MAYDVKNKQVSFFNIDVTRITEGKKATYGLTKESTTKELSNRIKKITEESQIDSKLSQEDKNYLVTQDEYALLCNIIAITTNNKKLKQEMRNPHVDMFSLMRTYPGAMNDRNAEETIEWIQEHVKPEYYSYVMHLLKNPALFAQYKIEDGFENKSLSEALIFQPSS